MVEKYIQVKPTCFRIFSNFFCISFSRFCSAVYNLFSIMRVVSSTFWFSSVSMWFFISAIFTVFYIYIIQSYNNRITKTSFNRIFCREWIRLMENEWILQIGTQIGHETTKEFHDTNISSMNFISYSHGFVYKLSIVCTSDNWARYSVLVFDWADFNSKFNKTITKIFS